MLKCIAILVQRFTCPPASRTTTTTPSTSAGGKCSHPKAIKVAMANDSSLGPANQQPTTPQIGNFTRAWRKKAKKAAGSRPASRGERADGYADVAQHVQRNRWQAVEARVREDQRQWEDEQQRRLALYAERGMQPSPPRRPGPRSHPEARPPSPLPRPRPGPSRREGARRGGR